MPNMRTLCDRIRLSLRAASSGRTRCSSSGPHSSGGPGSIMTRQPSASKAQAGAVPQSLTSTVHPSGRYTCWRWFSVI